jgi:hypothetical protein
MQQFRIYLAMLGGQLRIIMVHTPGMYYSIKLSTGTYQGKVMDFVGDRHAIKEPKPVCLPTSKSWEWHTRNTITDLDRFEAY